MCLYLLYQCQSGYALFLYSINKYSYTFEDIQHLITQADNFVDSFKLLEFKKFDSDDDASKQVEAFSKGQMTAELRKFLLPHLPEVKAGKINYFSLGVANPELGYNIYDATKIPCQSSDFVREVLSGVHMHFERYLNTDVMKVDTGNEVAGGNEDVNEATAKSSAKKRKKKKKKKSSELDVEETPVQPLTKKNKKKKSSAKKSKKKESSKLDVEETPVQPLTKKSEKESAKRKKRKYSEMDEDEAPTEPCMKKGKKRKS